MFLFSFPVTNILEARLLFLKVSTGKCQNWAEELMNRLKSLLNIIQAFRFKIEQLETVITTISGCVYTILFPELGVSPIELLKFRSLWNLHKSVLEWDQPFGTIYKITTDRGTPTTNSQQREPDESVWWLTTCFGQLHLFICLSVAEHVAHSGASSLVGGRMPCTLFACAEASAVLEGAIGAIFLFEIIFIISTLFLDTLPKIHIELFGFKKTKNNHTILVILAHDGGSDFQGVAVIETWLQLHK